MISACQVVAPAKDQAAGLIGIDLFSRLDQRPQRRLVLRTDCLVKEMVQQIRMLRRDLVGEDEQCIGLRASNLRPGSPESGLLGVTLIVEPYGNPIELRRKCAELNDRVNRPIRFVGVDLRHIQLEGLDLIFGLETDVELAEERVGGLQHHRLVEIPACVVDSTRPQLDLDQLGEHRQPVLGVGQSLDQDAASLVKVVPVDGALYGHHRAYDGIACAGARAGEIRLHGREDPHRLHVVFVEFERAAGTVAGVVVETQPILQSCLLVEHHGVVRLYLGGTLDSNSCQADLTDLLQRLEVVPQDLEGRRGRHLDQSLEPCHGGRMVVAGGGEFAVGLEQQRIVVRVNHVVGQQVARGLNAGQLCRLVRPFGLLPQAILDIDDQPCCANAEYVQDPCQGADRDRSRLDDLRGRRA